MSASLKPNCIKIRILSLALSLLVFIKMMSMLCLILNLMSFEMLPVFIDDRDANVVADVVTRVTAVSVTYILADVISFSLKLSPVLLHVVLLVKMMIVLSIKPMVALVMLQVILSIVLLLLMMSLVMMMMILLMFLLT